jgi:rhamnose utilization protein RhaD (predicted bifunctional aldolase and dehydrogenase)
MAAVDIKDEINNFCDFIGKDPLLVQGAGGNVSYKINNKLWIKASGTSLGEAKKKDIFVPLDLNEIRRELNNHNFDYKPYVINQSKLRPSIETLMHALMPHKIVVHLHAVDILSYLVRKNLSKVDDKINGVNSIFIEYFKPGSELAEAIFYKLEGKNNINTIFLKNHGIVFGAEDINEINSILRTLLEFFQIRPLNNFEPVKVIEDDSEFRSLDYKQTDNKKINSLVIKPNLAKRLKKDWAICPDHVVFLGEEAALIENPNDLSTLRRGDNLPPYIFYLNHGVFEQSKINKTQEEQLLCYCDVLLRQSDNEILDTLNSSQIKELLDWDAEKYRKKLQD